MLNMTAFYFALSNSDVNILILIHSGSKVLNKIRQLITDPEKPFPFHFAQISPIHIPSFFFTFF